MAARLREAGVPAEVFVVPRASHAFGLEVHGAGPRPADRRLPRGDLGASGLSVEGRRADIWPVLGRVCATLGRRRQQSRHWLAPTKVPRPMNVPLSPRRGDDSRSSPRRPSPAPRLRGDAPAGRRCSPSRSRRDAPAATPPPPRRAGITELEPGATLPTAAGQSIYLPIHTRIVGDDGSTRLTVNVAVRNTDESRPILVTLVRHRDADGNTVRDYLRAPARLAPKAILDVVLNDPDGPGPAASVLVEWVADRPVAPPMVEAVMIGRSARRGHSPSAARSSTTASDRRPAPMIRRRRLPPRPADLHHRPDRPVLGAEPGRDQAERRERAVDPVDVDHEPRPDLAFERVLARVVGRDGAERGEERRGVVGERGDLLGLRRVDRRRGAPRST